MTTLRIATLNIRNLADRWDERLPLLLADMAALQPDVLGLQEVVYPLQQDRLIAAAGERHYEIRRGWAGRPEYGNALLVADGLALDAVERLDLGLDRSALRGVLAVADASLLVSVTHLHHVPADETARDDQARQLLEWIGGAAATGGQIVVGDFNAEPDEPAAERMRAAGFRSALAEANGRDPDVTWPSGLQAPGMDTDGDPGCLDYIWVCGSIRVSSARLAFDRPAVGDPTLYPSDHLGLVVEIAVGRDVRATG
ncbi:MAG TPA: endonuclease/exonuclease/phosphatase family protein [Candidatus Limnocylindrales bacterium]|nr:endonuclease/exonuclease/phosphatase family protein [Candidatus Limnocylindrales bacterium]